MWFFDVRRGVSDSSVRLLRSGNQIVCDRQLRMDLQKVGYPFKVVALSAENLHGIFKAR